MGLARADVHRLFGNPAQLRSAQRIRELHLAARPVAARTGLVLFSFFQEAMPTLSMLGRMVPIARPYMGLSTRMRVGQQPGLEADGI